MSENMKYRKIIDDYLSGSISTSDKEAFENQLSSNAELKGEFEFQKNIIEQIRETRKLELKTRLDNINLPWHHTIPGSWKIAAAISVLTVSTLSAFFYINQQEQALPKTDLKETTPVGLTVTPETIPEKPVVSIDVTEQSSMRVKEDQVIARNSFESENLDVVEKTEPAGITDNTDFSTIDRQTEVAMPDMIDDEFGEINTLDMDDAASDDINNLNPVDNNMSGTLGVKTITNKKYNFHYKLSNGVLALYGNFEEIPYEILEINSADGKRFYLKYKKDYYPLTLSPEITELTPVTDPKILNELKIVEENK